MLDDRRQARPTRQDIGIEEQINPPTSGHTALLEQALQALRQDDRVLAVLLGGSLASGDADEESDIDLTVVVDDAVADAFNHERDWLKRMDAPVITSVGPMPNLLTSLMRDGLRLDVTVERRTVFEARPRRAVVALHDPPGLLAGVEFVVPRYEPTPEWLRRNVEDFLRFLDQLSVVVLREEWIAGVDNAWYLISQLVDLYAHENRAPRTSPRRMNARLTAGQRSAIESLPAIQATERAIVDVHVSVAKLFIPEAQEMYRQLGLEWPQELETAVRDHLQRRVGARI